MENISNMEKVILTILLAFPLSVTDHKLPKQEWVNRDFNALLLVCINGGHASIWIDHKPIKYVSCQPVAFPRRFPS